MRNLRPLLASLLLLALAVARGAADDEAPPDPPTGVSPSATDEAIDEALAAQLESVLLQQEEVAAGLQGGGLSFSTNLDLAGDSVEELDRLEQIGRLLGAEITFVPTQGLGPDVAARGGIQNSVSVYETPFGAGQTFTANKEAALSADWAESYPDFTDVRWRAVDRTLGDESAWVRITGVEECIVQTPSPAPGAPAPTGPAPTCAVNQQVIIDQVITRAGRAYIFFQVTSAVPEGSVPD